MLSPEHFNKTEPLQSYVFKPKASSNDSISGYKIPENNWLDNKLREFLENFYKE